MIFHGIKLAFAIVLSAVITTGSAGAGQQEALEAVLNQQEEAGLAFVALIARGEETVFEGAYGLADRKQKIPNGADTAFDIGSISKTFTAAAIYRLATAGHLDLDATIDTYLENVPPDKTAITIDHLLNHGSGLVRYHDRKGDFETMSRDKALERILDAPLRHEPGERYAYGNAAYTLLAILIEEITEQDFREHCRTTFFEPLGMTRTGFYGDRDLWSAETVAIGYGDSREGRNSPWDWRQDDLWAVTGNGGIVSTAGDLVRWAVAHDRFFPPPDPPKDLGDERQFSNGWYLATRESTGLQVFHGGATDKGFIALLRNYPEHDTTMVLLSNTFKAKKPHIRSYVDQIEDAFLVKGREP